MPTPGTGATFSVTTVSSGVITALSVTAAGSGYNVGDILTLSGGTTAATVTVATLSGTGVATVTITTGGAGYSNGNALTSTVTTITNPHSHASFNRKYTAQRARQKQHKPIALECILDVRIHRHDAHHVSSRQARHA